MTSSLERRVLKLEQPAREYAPIGAILDLIDAGSPEPAPKVSPALVRFLTDMEG